MNDPGGVVLHHFQTLASAPLDIRMPCMGRVIAPQGLLGYVGAFELASPPRVHRCEARMHGLPGRKESACQVGIGDDNKINIARMVEITAGQGTL
jgi:hypothetical protein